jgi:dihydrofolate synthase/folylpolyglutamate synthase
MNYEEFLAEIDGKSAGKKKLQLDNFTNYCHAVGNPEKSLKGIHVGGTNGKGSTCAILEALLFAHGFSTGLNTSPHLVHYKERFRINREEPAESQILNTYLQYRPLHEKYDTSFFEISTAIAFQMFADSKVDYAIAEVGMGGRLDATKLINTEISAITSIDFDHTKSLGNTLTKIAWQKAGIIKEKKTVVVGKMPAEAIAVIEKEADEKNAPVLLVEKEVQITNSQLTPEGNYADVELPRYNLKYENLFCNLVGIHQLENLATALLIVAEIARKHDWQLNEEKIRAGLKKVIWQGRMQTLSKNPRIIIDGAHNPAGIEKLVYNLSNIYNYEKLICVIAILFDKDFPVMIKNLSEIVDTFVICKSNSERASATKDLFEEAKKYRNVIVEKNVKEAINRARKMASERDMICITGSLYTISEALV